MYTKESQSEVIENYDGLLKSLVNKELVSNTRYSYDDLLSEARLAALEAINNWDDDKGKNIKFITYLTTCVKGHLKRFKKNNQHDLRVTEYRIFKDYNLETQKQSSDAMAGSPYDEWLSELRVGNKYHAVRLDWSSDGVSDNSETTMAESIPSGDLSPDIAMIKQEQVEVLMKEIQDLPERERYVIEARWLDRRKLEEIADDLGVKKQTIHTIEKKAREKLGKRVRAILGEELVE